MKEFIKEFKEFISRGNVMDMAVGIIIGGAFTNIVSSLVKDIINPILGLFGGMNFDQYHIKLLGQVTLNYGNFLTAVFNFLIMALVIFMIIKAMNTASEKLIKKEEAEEKVTTKVCPFCKSEVDIEATRCPHAHPFWTNRSKLYAESTYKQGSHTIRVAPCCYNTTDFPAGVTASPP